MPVVYVSGLGIVEPGGKAKRTDDIGCESCGRNGRNSVGFFAARFSGVFVCDRCLYTALEDGKSLQRSFEAGFIKPPTHEQQSTDGRFVVIASNGLATHTTVHGGECASEQAWDDFNFAQNEGQRAIIAKVIQGDD